MSAFFFAVAEHDTATHGMTLIQIFLSAIPGGALLAVPILVLILSSFLWQFFRGWIYGAIDGVRTFFAIGGHK